MNNTHTIRFARRSDLHFTATIYTLKGTKIASTKVVAKGADWDTKAIAKLLTRAGLPLTTEVVTILA
jgi:hypothetical protein